MLFSTTIAVIRTAKLLKSNSKLFNTCVRNSGHGAWNYRISGPPPSKYVIYLAEGIQGFAWWWVLWHVWTEPGHVIGEFEYPDTSKWTDEELGIPAE